MALAYEADLDDEPEPQTDAMRPSETLQRLANFEGNLVEALDHDELIRIGGDTVREWKYDKDSRKDWEDTARKALKLASQKVEPKNTPWPNASNVHYPTLTVASIQFAARAYPALVKGDEVLQAKVVGADILGLKGQRAQRLSTFANDQIIYECEEWEPGTDALLHALPIIGAGFRKVSWDPVLGRPRMDFASAMDVYAPADAPTFEQAPRLSQRFDRYPFQIKQLMKAKVWAPFEYELDSDDTQKPCEFIEQHRYLDLDGDGLDEPYIVTVETKNERVVRIDPAFDPNDIRIGQSGQTEAVTRMLPWVDYGFLPDPEGGLYGIGFGKLLETLQDTIDACLNQMMDAGKLANAPGGFVGQGLNLRAGTYAIEPGKFKTVNASGQSIRDSVFMPDFKGPNPVLFQLLDLLLAAAKDITSVKDVLTGEAPGTQPATSTLALIEQGMAVFTAIYKRIYRSLRKEYRLLFRLNARYLPPERYKAVLDQPLRPPQLPPNAPPMPPEAQQELEAELQKGVSPKDFENADYDIRPIADPSAVTQMQQLARAEFLMRFKGDPTVNQQEINRRVFEAARIEDPKALQQVPENPMTKLAIEEKAAEVDGKKADAREKNARADKTETEAKGLAYDQGVKQGSMGSVAGEPGDGMGAEPAPAPGGESPGAMDAGELQRGLMPAGAAG